MDVYVNFLQFLKGATHNHVEDYRVMTTLKIWRHLKVYILHVLVKTCFDIVIQCRNIHFADSQIATTPNKAYEVIRMTYYIQKS